MDQSLGRYRAATHRRTLGRYRSGRAASHRRSRTRASHAARLGDGDHNHHTDAYVFRCSVRWKNKVGRTQSSPSARSKTMTDEQLAAMHRLLAEYHRNLAKEATLDVVQHYHADLAQRLADEAALIPRRTAILDRLHEREQQKKEDGNIG